VGAITITADGGTDVEVDAQGVASVGITDVNGGAVGDTADVRVLGAAAGSVDLAGWLGDYVIDTTGVTAGVVIIAGADGGTLNAGGGADVITGGAGVDTIDAGAGADVVTGGAGNDVIVAGAGADAVDGGAGTDTITGGAGADALTGGTGADTFLLNSVAAADADTITDFTAAASGDVLKFDISDFALAGGDVYVGALASLAVDSSKEIVVLTGAGYASDEAAETAIAGQVTTDAFDVVAVYFNTATNKAHVIYDADAGVDGTATAVLVGVLSNITSQTTFDTLVAANFASQA